MFDHHEIPEAIRSYLATPGHPWTEDLTEVATAYATLCREANDRLRRCAQYLKQGMRSEAVQLAESQPRLLPLVDSLHIPDPAAWAQACVANGLTPAPPLLTDNLAQLEAAGEIELQLAPLLARHRLLALAKAPLRDRMEVLVPLHEKDPGNPVWVENLRTLGTARLKQIRADAQSAYRGKNLILLEQLSEELAGKSWQINIPDDLRKGVDRAAGFLRLESAKEELRPLLTQLRAAHSTGNIEEASELLRQWQQIIDARKMVLPKALQDAIRPIIAWVADEERRSQQEEKMQRMRPALEETERLFRSAERRHTLRIILIVLTLIIATGALIWLYLRWIGKRG